MTDARKRTTSRTLFIGIGSPHGDDRIGWKVADALREIVPSEVDIRQASTPSDLLDWLGGFDRLVLCDACQARSDARADTPHLHRWEWPTSEVSSLRAANSHACGLPQVLQVAERLGSLPEDVTIYGVEASYFDAFAELSPELRDGLARIVEEVADEVSHHA